jgi:plasmid stabilization system protein ParE
MASFLDNVLPLRLRMLSATLAIRLSSRACRESSERLIFDNAGTDSWTICSAYTSRKRRMTIPRGDKSSYTDKQKRQAEHIEDCYENRGVSHKEAERRAWATVNKETHGGKKSASGRGKPEDHSPPLGKAAARAAKLPPIGLRPNVRGRRRRRHVLESATPLND